MIRKLVILLFVLSAFKAAEGQSLNDYLLQVAGNNPEILSFRKLLEARRYEARTGNTPADPFISAGKMPGRNGTEGNKKTFSITQSFSFPLKYLLQKNLNNNTIMVAEQEFNLGKLQIMLDAKISYVELVYKTKLLNNLRRRKEGYDQIQAAWKKMLDNGQTTIMDYNRIMVEISVVNLEIIRTQADMNMLHERLAYLSGASSFTPMPGEYPLFSDHDPDELLKEKASRHPAYLIPVLEYEISLQEMKVSKAGALPEFVIGYESEIIPGETFSGPVGGISIPLWTNSNRIKAASANADHMSARRDASLQKLNSQVRNEYSNMLALQKSIDDLRGIIESGGGTKYLDSALAAGEIPVTTYITYLESIYESEDRLLELEMELHRSVAVLLDHELLLFP